jgi:RNA polymerase sigma-70 factor (ECF subfamily)
MMATVDPQLEQLSDAQLMAGVQQREQAGFAVLVSRHHARCFALAWRVLNDRAEAEDAVQEAFLKIWTHAERFDPARGQFGAWLTRIVTNCALDRRRLVKNVVALDEAAWVEDDKPRADRLAESSDLHLLMTRMPPRQRAAVSLFYIEGFSMQEVATMMQSNVKSVESMLSRGREALKKLLAEQEQAA